MRYKLEKYKTRRSRYTCPQCGRQNQLTRYIDTETGLPLAAHVGRCNREKNCGYHFTPKQYFEANGPCTKPRRHTYTPAYFTKEQPIALIPVELYEGSFGRYDTNNFITFLNTLFSKDEISNLIKKYGIGSSYKYPGATVFWQVDINHNIRTGKIMQYNPLTGKRVKDEANSITWVHKHVQAPPKSSPEGRTCHVASPCPDREGRSGAYNLRQCLFGEHLLNGNNNRVAIVESEKTAIISSMYYPDFVWVATGGLNNLTFDKTQCLTGRDIVLFPDLGCAEDWRKKTEAYYHFKTCVIEDTLERFGNTEELQQGCDIADYFISLSKKQWKPLEIKYDDEWL